MEPKKKTEIVLQPPKKANKRVYHSLTCDCDDVSITRLVEYINDTWVHDWNSVLNIVKMKFDIGHDILHFETNGQKLDLIKFILKLSEKFPKIFFMYDFYTINEREHEQGTYFVMGGKITDNNVVINKTEA